MQTMHPVTALDSNGRILAVRSLRSRPLTDVHSLPNEIIAAIFNAGALLPSDGRAPARWRELPFPLLVSSVSRHWRDVATSLPALWCDVLVSDERPREATELWLARSGKSGPLDVTLDARGRDRVGLLACFRDVVLPHLSRWRRLVVKATSHANLYPISELLKDASASRLQELQLDVTHTMWYFHLPFLTGGTPLLRSLVLRYPCPLCPIGFKNLVSLDIRPSSPRILDICELITASPGLTDLTIRGLYAGINGENKGKVIHANSLRSLAFSFAHDHPPDCCCCLFSLLSMPNLEYLEISTPSTRLCEHLRLSTPDDDHRKLPNLRVLRLQNLCFSREDADDALHVSKIARSVTGAYVTFSDIHSMSPFSDKVLVASKSNNRVPWDQLSVFTLNTPITQDLAWVESVVLDRIKAGIPLTRVRLPRAILPEIYTGKLALAWLQGHLRVEILDKDDEGRSIEEAYDDNYNDYDDYDDEDEDDENSSDADDTDDDEDSEEDVSEPELIMTAPLTGPGFLASIHV